MRPVVRLPHPRTSSVPCCPDDWSPPNDTVNADDFLSAIKTFLNPAAVNATHTSVTDVAPNQDGSQINRIVNIEDVLILIKGFKGNQYPGPDLAQCTNP